MTVPTDRVSFTVVTTTRNAARQLVPCLESVAAQTHPAVEHVIVDGASTDDTADVVRGHARPNFTFITEPDHGIYDAMNKGVAVASGDYLLFLGADDHLVDPRALADAASFLADEGLPEIVYGNLEVREEGKPTSVFHPPPPEEALGFLVYGCLPHQSTIAHRGIFTKGVGLFDARYRVHADYDWFLRAFAAEGVRIRYLPRTIGSFRVGGTSSQLQRGQEEFYAIQNSYPVYQQPVWMDRRLREFQKQTLHYRIQAQELQAVRPYPSRGRQLLSRASGFLSRLIRN